MRLKAYFLLIVAIKSNNKPKSSKHRRPKDQQDLDAISNFFAQYPSFAYDEEKGVAEEFYRMCDFFDWDRDDKERREAREEFKDALVMRFNSLYGTDVSDIENWHKLCVAVCIEPLPTTISECKKVCGSDISGFKLVSFITGNQRYTCKSCRSGRYIGAGRGVVYLLGRSEGVY